jgi:hypothetical protein
MTDAASRPVLTIEMITREALRVLRHDFEFGKQVQVIRDSLPPGPERDAVLRTLYKANRDRDIAELERFSPSPEIDEAISHIRAIWSKTLGEED